MCNKEMDKAAHWIGGYPVGPKCFAKIAEKSKATKSVAQHQEQADLWHDLLNQPEEQNSHKPN